MATVPALRRSKLSEQLATFLTDLILGGSYMPGNPLPTERELAMKYEVSIGVVREAMRRVAAVGLVEIRHGVGMFVSPLERWNASERMLAEMKRDPAAILHVHDVRVPLEIMSAEEAARRAARSDVAALESAVARMESTLHDSEATIAADVDFHSSLARATHNTILLLTLQPLIEPIHESMRRAAHLPEAAAHAVTEHRRILAAVRDQDVGGARSAMRQHMTTNQTELLSLLNEPEAIR